jgi:hypothetical protein
MKHALSLMVLAILLPAYGQEKSSQPSGRATNASELKQPASKTQPLPSSTNVNVVNQQTSSQEEHRAKNNAQGYLSRLLAPENLPNIALFLVGVVGIVVAIRTLRAIERQTHALIESQRPKISATAHGNPRTTLADSSARRVEINLRNNGATPAYDLLYESWIEILPFPFGDFTPLASHYKETNLMVLYPDTQPLVINIPIQTTVTEEQMHAVRRLRLHVCVRLSVTYRDAFGSRTANFGYYVQPNGLGFLPKYNSAS